jgi:two-component system, OmpR family, KDP operon response regulator KdpE
VWHGNHVSRVLVIDDEPQILRALRINLRVRQYDVDTALTGAEALEHASKHPPDLVILDLGLPDLDGVEVIQGLRGWTAAPIIVLSGRADSTDKVEALDAGADDYVTKPFGMEELLARMRAVGRRTVGDGDEPRYQLGDLIVDLAAKRVIREAAGRPAPDIRLTPTEWHLLEVLLRHPGKLLSQQQLLREVWGPGYAEATGNLRLYMAQLRHKLEPDPARPRWLLTEPGMGYRFQPGPETPASASPPSGDRPRDALDDSNAAAGKTPGEVRGLLGEAVDEGV